MASTSSKVHVLLLCGLPGSGKSTMASKLVKLGWYAASQDELGSRKLCEKYALKALKNGKSVVLDRCNLNDKERRQWIAFAKKQCSVASVHCIYLNVPLDECKRRVASRKNHPTLGDGAESAQVLDRFAKGARPPTQREGFTSFRCVASQSEVDDAFAFAKQLPLDAKGVKFRM
jgi:predicted kinase